MEREKRRRDQVYIWKRVDEEKIAGYWKDSGVFWGKKKERQKFRSAGGGGKRAE